MRLQSFLLWSANAALSNVSYFEAQMQRWAKASYFEAHMRVEQCFLFWSADAALQSILFWSADAALQSILISSVNVMLNKASYFRAQMPRWAMLLILKRRCHVEQGEQRLWTNYLINQYYLLNLFYSWVTGKQAPEYSLIISYSLTK